MKRILKNLACAICIIIYFLILVLAYTRMNVERLAQDIKVFSGMFLVLGLLFLEKSYKNDDGKTAISAIELLVLSFHSLSIIHITTMIKCEFAIYMYVSCGAIGIYYIIKSIVIYTKKKRDDLKSLSDISEIVKKDEPIKKEAKKRNIDKESSKSLKNQVDDIKAEKVKDIKKKSTKTSNESDKVRKGKTNKNNKTKTNNKTSKKAKSTTKKIVKEETEKELKKSSTKKKITKKEVKEND